MPTLVLNEETGLFEEVVVPPYIIDPRCTEEQRKVLEQVKAGKNVFFTGSAGVGKSFLLKEIRKMLEDEQRPYWVTASSGIAALQVEGTTTHSWAGLGLAQDCVGKLFMAAQKKADKWVNTKVLIIDEISMLGADFFTRFVLFLESSASLPLTDCIKTELYREAHATQQSRVRRDPNHRFGRFLSTSFVSLPVILPRLLADSKPTAPVPDKWPKCPRCEGTDWKRFIFPADSSLPVLGYPSGVVEPKVWRCGLLDEEGKKAKPGCGFERSDVRFCFETQTWCASRLLSP